MDDGFEATLGGQVLIVSIGIAACLVEVAAFRIVPSTRYSPGPWKRSFAMLVGGVVLGVVAVVVGALSAVRRQPGVTSGKTVFWALALCTVALAVALVTFYRLLLATAAV